MKVLKFGGTSVKNAERIEQVKNIVVQKLTTTPKLVVVVSALGGLTDTLIRAARLAESRDESYRDVIEDIHYRHRKAIEQLFPDESIKTVLPFLKEKTRHLENLLNGIFLIQELPPRVLDMVMSYGELLSSKIIAHYIQRHLPKTKHIDSRTVIKTNNEFNAARVDFDDTNQLIQQNIQDAEVYVMGGFIASNAKGQTTTLGRGGSDYTAALVAAAITAKEIEIWTDVNGVMTADPRKVRQAFSLETMTYEEALEMSHFGAKVIHPPTVQPALDEQIPIRICNTFNPSFEGTLITATTNDKRTVKGVTSIGDISLLSVEGSGLIGVTGIAGRLFTILARQQINIILITQASSEHSISFAVLPTDAAKAKQLIEQEFAFEIRAHLINEVIVENDLSIVAAIGSNMKNSIGICGSMFQALAKNGINIRAIAQGSSELNISTVINKADESKALNAIHDGFFLSDTKAIHLYLVGTGLIGSTLLEQIKRQYEPLIKQHALRLKVAGVTNSRQMLFNDRGIDLDTWSDQLAEHGEQADMATFVERMQRLNLRNSIFVDCTASEVPIPFYPNILQSSISIVTPNKIANSSHFSDYQQNQHLAQKYRVKFLYETNVGAGLPVISTLQDLLQSGDKVAKIEAVLSGSLSFIFNTFANGGQFSEIVQQAKEKGYTEPDPRDDLSGKDVARKVLILAREIGLPIELEDIEVENILPQACNEAPTVPEFFDALQANDDYFTKLRDQAAAENKVLRFLATIENDQCSVALKSVDAQNPFYSLSGSDNMIVFTTARYNERPLVVKGPGAGAEVTAAGVFAEIITTSNYLV